MTKTTDNTRPPDQPTGLVKQSDNPITALVQKFSPERYNVLAPRVYMDTLPPGTRLGITEVSIDPEPESREVFPIAGGALMPSKVSLDRIANAAGISWLEERRQDNARHPHYCEMFVRGRITDFDGTVREVTGVKAVDLREDAGGGEQGKDYAEIVAKASKAKRDPSQQLMEARKFIQEIAASKAKNRAIASALGIKRSYTREELLRPFIVPKLTIDPQSLVAQTAILANMMGATNALFGGGAKNIVDANFEEVAETTQASNSQAGGQGETGGVVGSLPPPPPVTTEPTGTAEVISSVRAAWEAAKKAGMDPNAFRALCQTQTGKQKKEEMTEAEADLVLKAVDAYIVRSDAPV